MNRGEFFTIIISLQNRPNGILSLIILSFQHYLKLFPLEWHRNQIKIVSVEKFNFGQSWLYLSDAKTSKFIVHEISMGALRTMCSLQETFYSFNTENETLFCRSIFAAFQEL